MIEHTKVFIIQFIVKKGNQIQETSVKAQKFADEFEL